MTRVERFECVDVPLLAARDDELAATAQGIDVIGVRSTVSGIAGAALALAVRIVELMRQ